MLLLIYILTNGHTGYTGTLAPTKGNMYVNCNVNAVVKVQTPDWTLTHQCRMLVGQIQRLGNQIKSAQARVEELQNRLKATSGGCHILLQEDTLTPPIDDLKLYNEGSDLAEAMGSLAVDPDGNAKYHGESAASEVRLLICTERHQVYLVIIDSSLS